jgi:hypothetical protein
MGPTAREQAHVGAGRAAKELKELGHLKSPIWSYGDLDQIGLFDKAKLMRALRERLKAPDGEKAVDDFMSQLWSQGSLKLARYIFNGNLRFRLGPKALIAGAKAGLAKAEGNPRATKQAIETITLVRRQCADFYTLTDQSAFIDRVLHEGFSPQAYLSLAAPTDVYAGEVTLDGFRAALDHWAAGASGTGAEQNLTEDGRRAATDAFRRLSHDDQDLALAQLRARGWTGLFAQLEKLSGKSRPYPSPLKPMVVLDPPGPSGADPMQFVRTNHGRQYHATHRAMLHVARGFGARRF